MQDQKQYWFPAKKYGWGWGLPTTWQGRAVLGAFFVLVGLGALALLPTYGKDVFMAYSMALCLALVVVCRVKGEPPRRRWRRK